SLSLGDEVHHPVEERIVVLPIRASGVAPAAERGNRALARQSLLPGVHTALWRNGGAHRRQRRLQFAGDQRLVAGQHRECGQQGGKVRFGDGRADFVVACRDRERIVETEVARGIGDVATHLLNPHFTAKFLTRSAMTFGWSMFGWWPASSATESIRGESADIFSAQPVSRSGS